MIASPRRASYLQQAASASALQKNHDELDKNSSMTIGSGSSSRRKAVDSECGKREECRRKARMVSSALIRAKSERNLRPGSPEKISPRKSRAIKMDRDLLVGNQTTEGADMARPLSPAKRSLKKPRASSDRDMLNEATEGAVKASPRSPERKSPKKPREKRSSLKNEEESSEFLELKLDDPSKVLRNDSITGEFATSELSSPNNKLLATSEHRRLQPKSPEKAHSPCTTLRPRRGSEHAMAAVTSFVSNEKESSKHVNTKHEEPGDQGKLVARSEHTPRSRKLSPRRQSFQYAAAAAVAADANAGISADTSEQESSSAVVKAKNKGLKDLGTVSEHNGRTRSFTTMSAVSNKLRSRHFSDLVTGVSASFTTSVHGSSDVLETNPTDLDEQPKESLDIASEQHGRSRSFAHRNSGYNKLISRRLIEQDSAVAAGATFVDMEQKPSDAAETEQEAPVGEPNGSLEAGSEHIARRRLTKLRLQRQSDEDSAVDSAASTQEASSVTTGKNHNSEGELTENGAPTETTQTAEDAAAEQRRISVGSLVARLVKQMSASGSFPSSPDRRFSPSKSSKESVALSSPQKSHLSTTNGGEESTKQRNDDTVENDTRVCRLSREDLAGAASVPTWQESDGNTIHFEEPSAYEMRADKPGGFGKLFGKIVEAARKR